MDTMTDIQGVGSLSRTFDSEVVKTNPFGRNSSGERLYVRSERIVAALHLITNHIPETEPARSRARKEGLELLSDVLALRDHMRAPESPQFSRLQARVRELISLVRMLSVSGHISAQNNSLVVAALDEIGNFLLSSQRSTLSESLNLTKEHLTHEVSVKDIQSIRDNKDNTDKQDVIKDIQRTLKIPPSADNPGLQARGEKIIQILKSNGHLGIKDISANLPEYSEKMIQRQLSYLSKVGRVKKVGFKRWSKYILTE